MAQNQPEMGWHGAGTTHENNVFPFETPIKLPKFSHIGQKNSKKLEKNDFFTKTVFFTILNCICEVWGGPG